MCVCVGVQLSHTALGNVMSPSVLRKETETCGWNYTRSFSHSHTDEQADGQALTSSGTGNIGCSSMDYIV